MFACDVALVYKVLPFMWRTGDIIIFFQEVVDLKYSFNVSISERDYYEYNLFWLLRSPYGRRLIRNYRLAILLLGVIAIAISLASGGFSVDSLLGVLPVVIIILLAQLFVKGFFKLSFKGQIQTMKKSGKLAYSPESLIEFGDNSFSEITPLSKNENAYSAVERVSVVENKMIYIHINNSIAYLLPFDSFLSGEQRSEFLEFIKSKCKDVKFY